MNLDRRNLLALAAAGGLAMASGAHAAGPRVLTFNHTDTPNGTRHAAAEFFAKKLNQYSKGALQTVVFHSGQVGNDPKSIELLVSGKLDFTVSATGSFASLNPELNLAMLPYLVASYEQGWALYDRSRWFADAFGKLPAKGVHVLSTFEAGFRSFTTLEPLADPAGYKGKPMRIFKNEIIEAVISGLGFEPKVMGITDVYVALQRGTVFGQENPIDTIYSQRFFEVAPHLTLTQHIYSPIPMAISEKTWKSFNESERQAVQRAATEAAAYSRQEVMRNDQRLLGLMTDAGAKVARPDTQKFRQALLPVYALAKQKYGASAEALLKEAAALK